MAIDSYRYSVALAVYRDTVSFPTSVIRSRAIIIATNLPAAISI
jgi:hypothetical protein